MQSLENRLIAVIADELGIPETEVTPRSRFADDYGVDDFGVASLAMRLNDEFDVSLSNDDVENVTTVGDLVDLVRELAPQAT